MGHLEIIFLGTGGSLPTKKRNLPSVVVKRGAEIIMFDCGEGTQKQLINAKIRINKKMKILITHMHGDHVLGLPGLFQSMSLLGRDKKIELYGPKGIIDFIESIERTVKYGRTFELKIFEVDEGEVIDDREYKIISANTDHGILCLAYSIEEKDKPGRFNPKKARELDIPKGPLWKKLQLGNNIKVKGNVIRSSEVLGPKRPGSKIVYATDTKPCESVTSLAKNADVLIHDSTFDEDRKEKADEYGHSTSSQAASVAKKSNSNKLILIHISAMYEDAENLLKQALKIHKKTLLAHDLMRIKV